MLRTHGLAALIVEQDPSPRASALDCEVMDRLGLLCLLRMEPLVAAHLHPRVSTMPSSSSKHPSKSDRLQSALKERAYKVSTLTTRTLNALSLVKPYQVELCQDFNRMCDQTVWDEIPVISDLCPCPVLHGVGYGEGYWHPCSPEACAVAQPGKPLKYRER